MITGILAIIVTVAFIAVARWVKHDPHFADPPRPSQLRRRQLDDLLEHDEVTFDDWLEERNEP